MGEALWDAFRRIADAAEPQDRPLLLAIAGEFETAGVVNLTDLRDQLGT